MEVALSCTSFEGAVIKGTITLSIIVAHVLTCLEGALRTASKCYPTKGPSGRDATDAASVSGHTAQTRIARCQGKVGHSLEFRILHKVNSTSRILCNTTQFLYKQSTMYY